MKSTSWQNQRFIAIVMAIMLAVAVPHAYAYQTTGCTWKSESVGFKINTTGGPSYGIDAILSSMDTWNDVRSSSFVFDHVGANTAGSKYDGANTICFAKLSSNTIGYCTWWYTTNGTTKQTLESDIQIRSNYTWNVTSLSMVTTHELGHTLGLNHSSTYDAVMNSVYHGQKKLHQDDCNGITYIYPGEDVQALPNIDGDTAGKGDLVLQSTTTGAVVLWLLDGITAYANLVKGTICPSKDLAWNIKAIKDFNGDGKADLLWQSSATGALAVWLMNGVTPYASLQSGTIVNSRDLLWRIKAVEDFNGDGKADILWHHATTRAVELWLMNGITAYDRLEVGTVYPALSCLLRIKAVDDFNGDGKADIVLQHAKTGQVLVTLMNGVTPLGTTSVCSSRNLNWRMKGLKDFNGDGKTDILWYYTPTGALELWLMNGATVLQSAQLAASLDLNWRIKAVDDFNGDGMADILLYYATTGKMIVWLMHGTVRTQAAVLCNARDLNWKIMKVSDISSDGKADILWRHATSGNIMVWLMNGAAPSGQLQTATIYKALKPEWMIK